MLPGQRVPHSRVTSSSSSEHIDLVVVTLSALAKSGLRGRAVRVALPLTAFVLEFDEGSILRSTIEQ